MQRLAGRRSRVSPSSISASFVGSGALSTKPRRRRISAVSFSCEPSRTGCRNSLSAGCARSGSANSANLPGSSKRAERHGYARAPSCNAEGLEQEFNSLAAQREACEAYIRSQQHEGWVMAKTHYDDGGCSGGNLERPALQRLLADVRAGRI